MGNDEIKELYKTEKPFNFFFEPCNSKQKIKPLIEKEHKNDQFENQMEIFKDSFYKNNW